MDWQIGPIEAINGPELKQRAIAAYTEKFGAEATDAITGLQRQQFDGLVGCLDHQLGWAEDQQAQGFAITVRGNAGAGAGRFGRDTYCELRVDILDRAPNYETAGAGASAASGGGTG